MIRGQLCGVGKEQLLEVSKAFSCNAPPLHTAAGENEGFIRRWGAAHTMARKAAPSLWRLHSSPPRLQMLQFSCTLQSSLLLLLPLDCAMYWNDKRTSNLYLHGDSNKSNFHLLSQLIFEVSELVNVHCNCIECLRCILCLYLLVWNGGTMTVHTSSMSINCGTNGHFCSCLIHALGTGFLSTVIISIFDPKLFFYWRTSLADCKTAADWFLSLVWAGAGKRFHSLLQNTQVFLKDLEQIEARQRSEDLGTQIVNFCIRESNLKIIRNADLTD